MATATGTTQQPLQIGMTVSVHHPDYKHYHYGEIVSVYDEKNVLVEFVNGCGEEDVAPMENIKDFRVVKWAVDEVRRAYTIREAIKQCSNPERLLILWQELRQAS
jgi:hypothetical protein